ncbi:MAG: helix-turn-helix domain-containing protein [Draconibacterium sp.]|nr:helix-turn-helix domain-containing protein [Draconibacterium sp.]
MAKTIDITVVESEQELRYLLRIQNRPRQQSRVKALLMIKQGKVRYPAEIAQKLRFSRRAVYDWLKSYKEGGIEGYLAVSSRGKRDEKLTNDEKETIADKLKDTSTDITSYVELTHWASQQFGREIPYHVIYKFCRFKLNSRLKIARKSHHKKDEQAVEAFKKTTPLANRI